MFTSDGRAARRVKLLVLGPEGVGKTSLIECLRTTAIQPRTNFASAPSVKGEKKSVLGSCSLSIGSLLKNASCTIWHVCANLPTRIADEQGDISGR